MTNVFGDGLDYEIDTEEILNEVDAKLKIINITNDQKFIDVNEMEINNLKLKSEILKENQVNYEKFKLEIKKQINDIKTEYEKFKSDFNVKFVEMEKNKSEYEKNKSEYEKLKQEIIDYKKQFKLLDRNITIWYDKVEKRFKEYLTNHLLNAKRKVAEAEKKAGKYFKATFNDAAKKYYMDKYSFTEEEFEAFKQYIEVKKVV